MPDDKKIIFGMQKVSKVIPSGRQIIKNINLTKSLLEFPNLDSELETFISEYNTIFEIDELEKHTLQGLETSVFIFIRTLISFLVFRKNISFKLYEISYLIIFVFIFLVIFWPANLYNLSIVKTYFMYFYYFMNIHKNRSNHTFEILPPENV